MAISKTKKPSTRLSSLFDEKSFRLALNKDENALAIFRHTLADGRDKLQHWHTANISAPKIITAHAWLIDQLLIHAWDHLGEHKQNHGEAALIAVGGYGRGELHPCSDIDLMILLPEHNTESHHPSVERFLQFLWDMGLDIGHSTRTVAECIDAASEDITVTTNIMEARWLTGNENLYKKMIEATTTESIWPSREFFAAKLEEQQKRHKNFDDTAYNLEPNIKEGPGGLRDIQMIMWVAQRHYNTNKLEGLLSLKLLSEKEYKLLALNRNFLWQLRNGLHYAAGRREDRLLFDHQRKLASDMGYKDKPGSLAVEQLMKRYYRAVKELSILNEILLQYFQEIILAEGQLQKTPIDNRFQSINGFIAVKDENIFKKDAKNIFRLFLALQQHPELKGVRARTIRLIQDSIDQINADFRNDNDAQQLFMEIIRQPRGITHEFRRMNTYGVLAAYIPAFGHIVGQMQHDLFHVYTVDEHTLFVVRNLRRFTVPEFSNEFPLASSIIGKLAKPERLYLAGLFHDIAKGRGGDHSELGEKDARRFCRKHGMSKYDTEFVCWLVRHHLIMSWNAQRRDLSDPEVIIDFARAVGDQEHLDNLYLLTVADMRGTSPKIWNNWKGHLLYELYHATSRVFMEGAASVMDVSASVSYKQSAVNDLLAPDKEKKQRINRYWSQLLEYYFLNFDIDSLAWHANTISESSAADFPIVATRYNPSIGGSEFLIYTPTKSDLFIQLTGAFEQLNLSIMDAKLHSSKHGFALDSFVVLDHQQKAIDNPATLDYLTKEIKRSLLSDTEVRAKNAVRMPRQLKHFPIKTEIDFGSEARGRATIMHVTAQDRPGLLHQVALALHHCQSKLVAAKIATFGERAEDIFFIINRDNQPITDESQLQKL
ncbi:MAG: [protein-PII] uridylyltransferase, partial [Proteobacteria bacterium]|nr:[protein-PII] uridylyltransferase [Pseudomonadota bacterium]